MELTAIQPVLSKCEMQPKRDLDISQKVYLEQAGAKPPKAPRSPFQQPQPGTQKQGRVGQVQFASTTGWPRGFFIIPMIVAIFEFKPWHVKHIVVVKSVQLVSSTQPFAASSKIRPDFETGRRFYRFA